MSELSIARRERIERVLVTRRLKSVSRRREPTTQQKLGGILVLMVFGFATVILGALFLVNAQWSPGDQDGIAREYRALRHDAATVAVGDRK